MRKFKIFTLSVFLLTVSLCTAGCERDGVYVRSVSELRQYIFIGDANGVSLTAFYGFKEFPYENDGKAGEKIYGFTFKIGVVPDEIKRTVKFSRGGKDYSADFAHDAVSGEYIAFTETDADLTGDFTVDYVCGSAVTRVDMVSVLPKNCLDYKQALAALEKKQKPLLDAYSADGAFNAEIYMRIIVREDKPYWYVGIAAGNGDLKALLVDGVSGEILAVREIK